MNIKDGFSIKRLSPDMIGKALALCDEYVGEKLYSYEELEAATKGDKSFFYLLYGPEREIIGYTYYLLLTKEEFLKFSKLEAVQFDSLGLSDDVVIGNLQSLSVVREYRGMRYATQLFDFMLDSLQKNTNAEIATGVLWRMGDEIPMKKVFEQFSFTHLADTELVWYDREDMYCPFCRGRCVCGASVYYKKLGGIINETQAFA